MEHRYRYAMLNPGHRCLQDLVRQLDLQDQYCLLLQSDPQDP